MKKHQEQLIPFEPTDERLFYLKFNAGLLNSFDYEFSQLDILQIMSHIKGRNDRLYDRFARLIRDADQVTGEKTNFSRKLPKRRFNGKLH